MGMKAGVIKVPAKASIWYIMASALGKVANVLILPFLTRLLGQEEYGRLGVYMALLGGVSVICSPFTSGSAIYKGIREFESSKREYLSGALLVSLSFSAILCILLFAFSSFLQINTILLVPLSLQIFCDVIISTSLSLKRYYYKYKTVATVSAVSAVIPPVLSIIILLMYKAGYTVRIYSLLLISLCLAVYSIVCILNGFCRPADGAVKYVIRHSVPLLPHSISTAFLLQADKLIITSVIGAAALAKYSVVYSLGSALQFTVSAIASALGPWIIRRLASGENERISQLIKPTIIGYSALSVCLVAISPEAMTLLAPKEYAEALPALLPIALSTPISFINTVINTGIVYSGKGKYSIILSIINAIASISLNSLLISRLGYLGAGLTLLLCQVISALLGILMLRRTELWNILPVGITFTSCFIGMAFGYLVLAFQSSVVKRIFLLIIPAMALMFCAIRAKDLLLEKKEPV